MSASAIKAGEAFVKIWADDAQTQAAFKSLQGKVRSFTHEVTMTGKAVFTAGLAMAAPFAASARTFMGFQTTMAKVRSVAEATGEEFKKLYDTAKKLGGHSAFTPQGMAEGMLELARAGYRVNEVMASLPALMDFARGGDLKLEDAATYLTDTTRAFGLQAEESRRVVDALTKGANVSTTDVYGIAEAMKHVASNSRLAGQGLESTTAALAVMANRGVKGEMAGTALRRVLIGLADAKNRASLKDVFNIDVSDASGNLRDVLDIIRDLQAATAGMGNAEKMGMFHKWFDARGMGAAISLTENIDEWQRLTQEIQGAEGTTKSMADAVDNTLSGAFQHMLAAVGLLRTELGEAIDGTLRGWMGAVRGAALAMADFVKENGVFVAGLMKIGAVVLGSGAALYGFGKAATAIAGVAKLASNAVGALKSLRDRATGMAQAEKAHEAAIREKQAAQEAYDVAARKAETSAARVASAQSKEADAARAVLNAKVKAAQAEIAAGDAAVKAGQAKADAAATRARKEADADRLVLNAKVKAAQAEVSVTDAAERAKAAKASAAATRAQKEIDADRMVLNAKVKTAQAQMEADNAAIQSLQRKAAVEAAYQKQAQANTEAEEARYRLALARMNERQNPGAGSRGVTKLAKTDSDAANKNAAAAQREMTDAVRAHAAAQMKAQAASNNALAALGREAEAAKKAAKLKADAANTEMTASTKANGAVKAAADQAAKAHIASGQTAQRASKLKADAATAEAAALAKANRSVQSASAGAAKAQQAVATATQAAGAAQERTKQAAQSLAEAHNRTSDAAGRLNKAGYALAESTDRIGQAMARSTAMSRDFARGMELMKTGMTGIGQSFAVARQMALSFGSAAANAIASPKFAAAAGGVAMLAGSVSMLAGDSGIGKIAGFVSTLAGVGLGASMAVNGIQALIPVIQGMGKAAVIAAGAVAALAAVWIGWNIRRDLKDKFSGFDGDAIAKDAKAAAKAAVSAADGDLLKAQQTLLAKIGKLRREEAEQGVEIAGFRFVDWGWSTDNKKLNAEIDALESELAVLEEQWQANAAAARETKKAEDTALETQKIEDNKKALYDLKQAWEEVGKAIADVDKRRADRAWEADYDDAIRDDPHVAKQMADSDYAIALAKELDIRKEIFALEQKMKALEAEGSSTEERNATRDALLAKKEEFAAAAEALDRVVQVQNRVRDAIESTTDALKKLIEEADKLDLDVARKKDDERFKQLLKTDWVSAADEVAQAMVRINAEWLATGREIAALQAAAAAGDIGAQRDLEEALDYRKELASARDDLEGRQKDVNRQRRQGERSFERTNDIWRDEREYHLDREWEEQAAADPGLAKATLDGFILNLERDLSAAMGRAWGAELAQDYSSAAQHEAEAKAIQDDLARVRNMRGQIEERDTIAGEFNARAMEAMMRGGADQNIPKQQLEVALKLNGIVQELVDLYKAPTVVAID